jgi:hypothetical protein
MWHIFSYYTGTIEHYTFYIYASILSFVCQVFNAKTKKWSKVAAMNCKRSAVGAVALGDHLYVCGGFDGISRFEPPSSKLMLFNSIGVVDICTRRQIQYFR